MADFVGHHMPQDDRLSVLEAPPYSTVVGQVLDPGEKELLGYVLSLPSDTYFLCSPDKALVRAAFVLKLIDRYVALEDMTDTAGLKPALKYQYTKRFMSEQRTRLLLEEL